MILLDLAHRAGLSPKKVAATHGGEYHSPCPACEGRDRFYMHPHKRMKNCTGSYCCRQCGIHGDAIQFARDFLSMTFEEAAQACNAQISPTSHLQRALYQATKNISNHPKIESLSPLWQQRAQQFVTTAHDEILRQPAVLDDLHKRGITIDTIRHYKIGFNLHTLWFDKREWDIHEPGRFPIPKGIVIPSLDKDGSIMRIKVRCINTNEGENFPKYMAIPGSSNGLNIIGNTQTETMIITESELDAYAVYSAVNDFAYAVAVGSSMKNTDSLTHYYAQRTKILLICHDNDDTGKKMLAKWQDLYPHAKACPTSYDVKDIGEAVQQGLNLRCWLASKISLQHGWNSEIQALIKMLLDHITSLPAEHQRSCKSIIYKIATVRPIGVDTTTLTELIDGLRAVPGLLQGAKDEKEKARITTAQ